MKITYIISHRSTNDDRDANLRTILKWINCLEFEKEIIIVEQDSERKLTFLPPSVQHIFVKNTGLFSKAWGMNIGIRNSTSDIIAFCDSDCVFKVKEMNLFLGKFVNAKEFDIGSPNRFSFIRLKEDESDEVRKDFSVLDSYKRKDTPKGTVITGGLFIVRKKALDSIKWWDEDFRGWGGEDSAISSKFGKSRKVFLRLDYTGYHLWHSGGNGEDYFINKEKNEKLWRDRYCGHTSNSNYASYLNSIDINTLGDIHKYET